MKQKHIIDTFKGLTGPVVLALILIFHREQNTTVWVYLALHGVYGILWILKSKIFGDKQWEQPVTLIRSGMLVSGLSMYWIAPLILAYYGKEANPIQIALAVSMFGFGVFFHFGSDLQKYVTLQMKPGLITTGLFARTRNPNYFGELLIYSSFSLLPIQGFSWWIGFIPAIAFASIIAVEWIPNILRKEKSLSRYPDFASYKKRSALIIPFIF